MARQELPLERGVADFTGATGRAVCQQSDGMEGINQRGGMTCAPRKGCWFRGGGRSLGEVPDGIPAQFRWKDASALVQDVIPGKQNRRGHLLLMILQEPHPGLP